MNIIVTGTSRGIGRELVKEFCNRVQSGNIHAFTRSKKEFAVLDKECRKINSRVKVTGHFDSDGSRIAGRIAIMVNNAGFLVNKPFGKISGKDLREVYEANVFYPFEMIQAVLPRMGKDTHVVNISSMGGVQGSAKFAGLSAYSSSKGALAVLTECLAEEL